MPNTQVLKEIAQYAGDENEKALLTLMGSYSEEGKVKEITMTINKIYFSIYVFV